VLATLPLLDRTVTAPGTVSPPPAQPLHDTPSEPTPEVGARSARIIALTVGLVIVALLGLMVWGVGKRAAGTTGSVPVASRSAPAFTIPLFEGGSFDLAAHRGTPVLINFWASWCIPCEEEAAALEAMSRAYQDRVVFIGVNVQDTEPLARSFLKRFGVTYPNGRDATGAVAVEYGMSGVPETYFVDRNGMVVRKWQGPLDEPRLRQFLDDLLR
jgi:cytochrome c biogenesis protein CcmG, thiol:disulfide interchange protein DsbE